MADSLRSATNSAVSLPRPAARPLDQKSHAAPLKHLLPLPLKQAATSMQKMATPQQLQQLKQARAKLGAAAFAQTLPEILRKFAKYPPLLTFHIYETHYRFNNTQDSSIIPKESPMARSFLEHIIREEIPVEMTELLKDFAIRFYDGCLVVQVYDHRQMVAVPGAAALPSNAADAPKEQAAAPATRPKTYRTLLRPTPQSLYYDLLYHTDSTLTKFTDLLALQMEAEILTLTNRKLDLAVPLNPYLQDNLLQPEIEHPKAVWDEELGENKVIHSHRAPTEVEVRKLHQEQMTMQKSSEFEEMMFLLSSKYKHPSESTAEKKLVVVGPSITTLSSDTTSLENTPSRGATLGLTTGSEKSNRTGAPAAINSASSVLGNNNATSNQFMRLRFIEEIRKRKESQKAQAGAAITAHTQSAISNIPSPAAVSATVNGGANGAFQRLGQPSASSKAPLANVSLQQGQLPMSNAGHVPTSAQTALQSSFQQSQQFQKQQQQAAIQQRQSALYAQQGKANQQQFSAVPSLTQSQRQFTQKHTSPDMTPNFAQDFATSPIPQGARDPQAMARQNHFMQNSQKVGQSPGQQQHQMAKQADRIRAQQFQAQQARQQQQPLRQPQQQSPQPSAQNYTQLKQQQQAAQFAQLQAAKRQKLATGINQIPQQSQYPQLVRTPQVGNIQPGSNVNTPIVSNTSLVNNGLASSSPQIPNQMPQMSQLAQGQGLFKQNLQNNLNNRPASQPVISQAGQSSAPKSTAQQQQQRQQQQQIFQMTLTPQEQHTFRQLQTRMNTLAQMSNTGVAPNGTRLTSQQQQQALQQAKHIQQQLLQRFPTYFQRLRQYQALQDERLLAMQRQHVQGRAQLLHPQTQNQSQNRLQNNMSMVDGSMFSQLNAGLNSALPAMQQQMMSLPMMPQMENNMQQGQGNH